MKQTSLDVDDTTIKTALLLAAGTGSRLLPLTLDAPKCLTEVGGKTILGRLTENLQAQGIKRLVIVTGRLEHCIREFFQKNPPNMQIDYISNPHYKTTNNIYSLWIAREIIQEPFILIESDLVFEESLLQNMLKPNRIAVSKILPWMNGTTVSLKSDDTVSAFHSNTDQTTAPLYKTVNIYSLSLQNWANVIPLLDHYISAGRVNEYYEVVFAEMIANRTLTLQAVPFDENAWYEVDNLEDLSCAELMFPEQDPHSSLHTIV